jgi:hypothetical protein
MIIIPIKRATAIIIIAIMAELRPPPPVECDVDVPVGDEVWVAVEVVRDMPVLNVVTEAVLVGKGTPDVGESTKLVVKSQVVGAAAPFEYTENTLPLKPS